MTRVYGLDSAGPSFELMWLVVPLPKRGYLSYNWYRPMSYVQTGLFPRLLVQRSITTVDRSG